MLPPTYLGHIFKTDSFPVDMGVAWMLNQRYVQSELVKKWTLGAPSPSDLTWMTALTNQVGDLDNTVRSLYLDLQVRSRSSSGTAEGHSGTDHRVEPSHKEIGEGRWVNPSCFNPSKPKRCQGNQNKEVGEQVVQKRRLATRRSAARGDSANRTTSQRARPSCTSKGDRTTPSSRERSVRRKTKAS